MPHVANPPAMCALRRARKALASCDDKESTDLVLRCHKLIRDIQLGAYKQPRHVSTEIRSIFTELEILRYSERKSRK